MFLLILVTTANLPKTFIGLGSDKMISSYNDCISSAVTVHWLRTVAHICQILCNTGCKRPISAAVMFRDINKGDARWRTFLWAFLYLQVNQMHLELLISFFVIIFTKRICLITSIQKIFIADYQLACKDIHLSVPFCRQL